MDFDYDACDATALAAVIQGGAVSTAEVLELALARIDERNPVINAVVARRDEEARAEVAGGLPPGPLHGVPMLFKDLQVNIRGLPTTRGSRLFADAVADRDSEIVRRYRAAGAVPIGLTNTPEFGKNASTEPVLHGPTRNPRALTRSPGGSSGGAAAAVAAGIIPAAHGNDGGGSIRIPASFCGLIGLKPSRGRVSAAPADVMLSYPMGINHALTRTVRDSAMLLDIAHGPTPGDPYVIPPPVRPYVDEVGADPGRLRIAVSTTMPDGSPADVDCSSATLAAAKLLESLGHHVTTATLDYPVAETGRAMATTMGVPLVVDVDQRLAELGRELADDDIEPFSRWMYEFGKAITGAQVNQAMRDMERVAHHVGGWFADVDLVLTPTMGVRVPELGFLDTTDPKTFAQRAGTFSALTAIFNVTGQPAISLPLGTDRDGLPVGVQLVARFGGEDVLLRVAAQLEAAGAWDTSPAAVTG